MPLFRINRHVLFVIGSLAKGGAETQLSLLARGLQKQGWTVDVFCLEKTGPLVRELETAGIKVVDGGFRSATNGRIRKIGQLILAELALVSYLLRSDVAVVNGFLPLSNFMAAVAGRVSLRRRIVTSRRGLGNHQDRHPRLRFLDHISNALSHVVTANAVAIAEDMERRDGYPATRVVVIPNGVDYEFDTEGYREGVRDQLGLTPSDVGVVMVANLIPYKGHADLIAGFASIASHNRRLHLFLAGDDRGIGRDLREQACQLGLEEQIHFLGLRSDISVLLSAMDLGIIASHEEGLSNALIEKLAAGLPVIATDVGGNAEVLSGMPGCTLVPPRNPQCLASALKHALDRPDLSAETRSIRQNLIRARYSVEAMVNAYERIYG